MAEIKGAHIFSVGTWNDLTFSAADLDAIAQSFNDLKLSGRVPLKFGHNDEQAITDGQPAIGWVSRVWREGNKLLADFSNIPSKVYEAIKNQLYKFVSIELLRDAKREGVTYPSVLDAVALLGADPPAVTNLDELSALAWSRKETGLQFSSRLAFTQGNLSFNISGASKHMDQAEVQKLLDAALGPLKAQSEELQQKFSASESRATKLAEENAALKKAQADRDEADRKEKIEANKARFTAITEAAVKRQDITGGERDKLRAKFMKDDESILNIDFAVVEMIARHENASKPDKGGKKVTAFTRSNDDMQDDAEQSAVAARGKVDEVVADMRLKGDKRDAFTLTAHVLRMRPDLARPIHEHYLAGDRE